MRRPSGRPCRLAPQEIAASVAAFTRPLMAGGSLRGKTSPYQYPHPPPGGPNRPPSFTGTPTLAGSANARVGISARHANDAAVRILFDPPLAHCKPETRSLTGPFFFLFQRGLARPSDFRRLAIWPKSVSERPASLSIRPSTKSRRIQKITRFQHVGEIKMRRS